MNVLVRLSFLLSVAVGGPFLPSASGAQGIVTPRDTVLFPLSGPELADGIVTSPLGAMIWLAQSCDGDCTGGSREQQRQNDNSLPRYGANLNRGTTNDIVHFLNDANKTCNQQIERRYRLDCLRIYYGWIADSLPDNGDYYPIKQAMRRAEMKLDAIVSANVDRTAPTITPRKGYKPYAKKLPPLRAVKKSSVKNAMAQAEAVVKETQLVILRSGEDPTRRTAHYEEVSAALDSNLVILRSA